MPLTPSLGAYCGSENFREIMKTLSRWIFKLSFYMLLLTLASGLIVEYLNPDRIAAYFIREKINENQTLLVQMDELSKLGEQAGPYADMLTKIGDLAKLVDKWNNTPLVPKVSTEVQQFLDKASLIGQELSSFQSLSLLKMDLEQVERGGAYPEKISDHCQGGIEAFVAFHNWIASAQKVVGVAYHFFSSDFFSSGIGRKALSLLGEDQAHVEQSLYSLLENLDSWAEETNQNLVSLKSICRWASWRNQVKHTSSVVFLYQGLRKIHNNSNTLYEISFGLMIIALALKLSTGSKREPQREQHY